MSKIHATAVGNLVEGRSNLLDLATNVSNHEVAVDGKNVTVSLRDTGHMEELDRLQPAVYRDTNCFLLCYSENDRASFNAIESKWCQEITSICPNVPYILVAYKSGNSGGGDTSKAVTMAEGQKLRQKINAAAFFEYASEADLEPLLSEVVKAKAGQRSTAEPVHATPGPVDEGGSSGFCSCFQNCFKKKDSSYSFQ